MGRELVPRVPSPKLIPQGDGDVGVPWDAHVCPEASRARRILSVLLRRRVRHISFAHMCSEQREKNVML